MCNHFFSADNYFFHERNKSHSISVVVAIYLFIYLFVAFCNISSKKVAKIATTITTAIVFVVVVGIFLYFFPK